MKTKTVRPLGLYLHIPFCKSKCTYCDFYSLPRCEEKMDAYVAALADHLTETAPMAAGHTVDTVYFGGGTPSYLGAERMTQLLQTVKSSTGWTARPRSPWKPTPTAFLTKSRCALCVA